MRCFVGLPLEPDLARGVRERVALVLDPAEWRLHPEEDLHLTLCFLGETAAERIEPLGDALRVALTDSLAPKLALRGTGCFGDPHAARVLWAAVGGEATDLARLARLREASARAVVSAGLRWDHDGAFTPHVTVARARGRGPAPERFAALEFEFPWQPREVRLFASLPGSRPHYPVLAAFPLKCAGA